MLATDDRDPTYVASLRALYNFTWVDPLIRRFSINNYEVYVGVQDILEAASRILVRYRHSCSPCEAWKNISMPNSPFIAIAPL